MNVSANKGVSSDDSDAGGPGFVGGDEAGGGGPGFVGGDEAGGGGPGFVGGDEAGGGGPGFVGGDEAGGGGPGFVGGDEAGGGGPGFVGGDEAGGGGPGFVGGDEAGGGGPGFVGGDEAGGGGPGFVGGDEAGGGGPGFVGGDEAGGGGPGFVGGDEAGGGGPGFVGGDEAGGGGPGFVGGDEAGGGGPGFVGGDEAGGGGPGFVGGDEAGGGGPGFVGGDEAGGGGPGFVGGDEAGGGGPGFVGGDEAGGGGPGFVGGDEAGGGGPGFVGGDEAGGGGSGFVVGVDFGTLSARALVVRVSDGAEVGTAVSEYGHAVIERELPGYGELPPDWALQDPADYIDALRAAVPAAVRDAGIDPGQVIGIATDFTASTCMPVLADGTPLCQLPGLAERPHAYPKLWKHHAAQPHADRINATAHRRGEKWINRYGGKISAEWQFAKALQLLDEDPELYQAADRWIEAADWIVWQLCGAETRNACTAGYKGIFQDGQYPSRDFLAALDPCFADFADAKLAHPIAPLGGRAGELTPAAAELTGLPAGIAVAVGNVDAHVTVPAAGPIAVGKMVAIMGTSTCHVMNGQSMNGAGLAEVPGMCGAVDGGIVAGLWGYEAGQSGVGDIFAWFTRNGVPGEFAADARRRGVSLQQLLDEQAAAEPAGAHGLIALDWEGGNRSVLVDAGLSGVIVGLTLATTAPEIYRALLESTAFGTRMIIDTFTASGVPVTELVVAGGLIKSAPLMQIYADVLRRPLSVIGSGQGGALGSAIHAAVAAGAYPDVPAAAAVMGRVERDVYQPDEARADVYDELYAEYVRLHDYFGRGGNEVMHRLRAIRDRALSRAESHS